MTRSLQTLLYNVASKQSDFFYSKFRLANYTSKRENEFDAIQDYQRDQDRCKLKKENEVILGGKYSE